VSNLVIRNVPDDVVAAMARLAAREQLPVEDLVLRELAYLARRANNFELLGDLPDLGMSNGEILAAIDAGRERIDIR